MYNTHLSLSASFQGAGAEAIAGAGPKARNLASSAAVSRVVLGERGGVLGGVGVDLDSGVAGTTGRRLLRRWINKAVSASHLNSAHHTHSRCVIKTRAGTLRGHVLACIYVGMQVQVYTNPTLCMCAYLRVLRWASDWVLAVKPL
jgi:hypothetical protein